MKKALDNILIRNIHVLRRGEGGYFTAFADVCVSGGIIISVGERPLDFRPDSVIEGFGKLLIPGLVNAHTHTYMSVMRNYADDLPFDEWLFGKVMKHEDKMTPEEAYKGVLLSCVEMIRTGTTCFLDMHMFKGQTVRAVSESGMRAVISRGLSGEKGDGGAERRLSEALDEIKENKNSPMLSFMLAPHAIYTCGESYLKEITETAKKLSLPLHIHLSETLREVGSCIRTHNCSPVAYLEGIGLLEVKTTAAHCVHVSDTDVAILASHGVSAVINTKSNLKLGSGLPPLVRLAYGGVNTALGTDSQASNNSLNMFSEMNAASLLQKGITGDPAAAPADFMLDCATMKGAKALSIASLGEIREGYKADLVVIDLDRPELCPQNSVVSSLVYSADGSEVETVIIGGKIVMRDGRLLTVDEEKLIAEMKKGID